LAFEQELAIAAAVDYLAFVIIVAAYFADAAITIAAILLRVVTVALIKMAPLELTTHYQ